MKITFWNNQTINEFWEYVRILLEGISPGILISVAIVAVGLVLTIIVNAWKRSSKDLEKDDDIEIRHY